MSFSVQYGGDYYSVQDKTSKVNVTEIQHQSKSFRKTKILLNMRMLHYDIEPKIAVPAATF